MLHGDGRAAARCMEMRAVPRRRIPMYPGTARALLRLAMQGRLISGECVGLFEKAFAGYLSAAEAAAVSSGSAALALILEALGLQAGDEVILPAYTCQSVPGCLQSLGLVPRFVDCDPCGDNMDPRRLLAALTARTRAVIATHIFGRPCAMEAIGRFAREHRLFLIEDCAHALGAEIKGRKLGTWGNAAYFSFSLTKPFGAFNGGMVVTNDRELAARIRAKIDALSPFPRWILWRNIVSAYALYWLTRPVLFTGVLYPVLRMLAWLDRDLITAYNSTFRSLLASRSERFKLSNAQACVGLLMLQAHDGNMRSRAERFAAFRQLCAQADCPLPGDAVAEAAARAYPYFFIIKHPRRLELARELLRRRIDTGKFLMRDCAALFPGAADCPHAAAAYADSLQIPVEHCEPSEMARIIEVLKSHGSGEGA